MLVCIVYRNIKEVWLVKLSYPPGLAQSGRLCRQCRIVSGRLLRAPPRFHVALSLGIHHLVHLHLALVAGHHGVNLLIIWYVPILFLAVLPVCIWFVVMLLMSRLMIMTPLPLRIALSNVQRQGVRSTCAPFIQQRCNQLFIFNGFLSIALPALRQLPLQTQQWYKLVNVHL